MMTYRMNAGADITIEEWLPDASVAVDTEIEMLAEVLHAVVHAGASVNFCIPFSIDEAREFWLEKVLPKARVGTLRILIARHEDRIVGTVQLNLEMPPNQQHRADVAKLLVHPSVRRRGVGRSLMTALEEIAFSEGRTLLVLDTVTGSNAEFLYRSLDYVAVGVIPRYARAALTPELESTTVMYKELT